MFHTTVVLFYFIPPFPNHTEYCATMGLRFSLPPFLHTNTRMLWSGVFLPTSSRAFGGYSWSLAFGWKGRVSGLDGVGWGWGPPPLGAACLGTACPTLHWGQTVLEGHGFWRDSGRLFLFFCSLVVYCFVRSYCGPLSSPRKVPAHPTK